MGFVGNWKGQRALVTHQQGDHKKALTMYEDALKQGADKPAVLIGYAVLLLRDGQNEKAVDILRKAEKAPGVTKEQKNQIIQHYAVAISKQGKLDHAIELLRNLFGSKKTGTMYGILGCLLIEQGDYETALAFNREAVEYDEDDPICLENLAQTYYRLGNDPAAARPLFEKAHQLKPSQIDTLYFLAQYDLEDGKQDEAKEKLEQALEGKFGPLNYATKERIQAQLATLCG